MRASLWWYSLPFLLLLLCRAALSEQDILDLRLDAFIRSRLRRGHGPEAVLQLALQEFFDSGKSRDDLKRLVGRKIQRQTQPAEGRGSQVAGPGEEHEPDRLSKHPAIIDLSPSGVRRREDRQVKVESESQESSSDDDPPSAQQESSSRGERGALVGSNKPDVSIEEPLEDERWLRQLWTRFIQNLSFLPPDQPETGTVAVTLEFRLFERAVCKSLIIPKMDAQTPILYLYYSLSLQSIEVPVKLVVDRTDSKLAVSESIARLAGYRPAVTVHIVALADSREILEHLRAMACSALEIRRVRCLNIVDLLYK